MRFLLHKVVEELHIVASKENQDYFTHESEVTFAYDSDLKGYLSTIPGHIGSLIPIKLYYQDLTSEPEEDWYEVQVVMLSQYDAETSKGRPVAAYLGNSWQDRNVPHFRINLKEDSVSSKRWRIRYRALNNEVLGYDDIVPFIPEFSSLVENMLALECLPLVMNDSPSWSQFMSIQTQSLMGKVQIGKMEMKDWLNRQVENQYITVVPYHYRNNNPLTRGRSRRHRTEWT